MNANRIQAVRAIADLAWTALALGIIAYAARDDLRKLVAGKRAEIAARKLAAADRAREAASRLEFGRARAPKLILEESNATENMEGALSKFADEHAHFEAGWPENA